MSTRRRLSDSIKDVLVWALFMSEEDDFPLLIAPLRVVEREEEDEEINGCAGGMVSASVVSGATGKGPEIVIPAMVVM